ADLEGGDGRLRVVRLSSEKWDLTECLGDTPPRAEIVAVVGLDETPGVVPEGGAARRRPPTIASLNHARELLRKRLTGPLMVWCDPLTYTAMQDHAPDFFDHYTALFTFLDAAPPPSLGAARMPSTLESPQRAVRRQIRAVRAEVSFYEN